MEYSKILSRSSIRLKIKTKNLKTGSKGLKELRGLSRLKLKMLRLEKNLKNRSKESEERTPFSNKNSTKQ